MSWRCVFYAVFAKSFALCFSIPLLWWFVMPMWFLCHFWYRFRVGTFYAAVYKVYNLSWHCGLLCRLSNFCAVIFNTAVFKNYDLSWHCGFLRRYSWNFGVVIFYAAVYTVSFLRKFQCCDFYVVIYKVYIVSWHRGLLCRFLSNFGAVIFFIAVKFINCSGIIVFYVVFEKAFILCFSMPLF